MVSKPSDQALALACGADGAYVDVTDDLVTDSVKGSWGRTSAFGDTRPGVFSFDLVNDDGKYTPGNPNTTLVTPVRVGMGVSHVIDGMQFAGTIRSTQPYFTGPDGLSGAAKLHVTCDDMLGNAARRELEGLAQSTFESGTGIFRWLLNESSAATVAEESFAGGKGLINTGAGTVTFGVTGSHIPVEEDVVRFDAASTARLFALNLTPFVPYTSSTLGAWSFWVERDSDAAEWALIVTPSGLSFGFNIRSLSGDITMLAGNNTGARVIGPPMVANTPYFCSVSSVTTFAAGTWTVTLTLHVDGVNYGSASYTPTVTSLTTAERQPSSVSIGATSGSGNVFMSHLSHTFTVINEYFVRQGTADVRLQAIAEVVPEIILDTLPTMSTATLALSDMSGQSALDALNDVIRTEQGYVWTETTGSVTSPVQKVKVRSRDRDPASSIDAAHSFSLSEILNAPEFTTDIENMVSSVAVRGPEASVVVQDPDLSTYVGSASDSASVLLLNPVDLIAWGEDRLIRGAVTDVRMPQFVLDALAVDRWDDISALRPGDRVRITGVPTAQFGISYIDGWLLGSTYSLRFPSLHGEDQLLFTFYFQPVIPDTAIYDTNYWMADGALTLSSAIASAGATTMSVATTGPKLETSAVPYDLMVDDERVTVTACTGATPQVATITRGVGGTTATTHTTSAVIEVPDASFYAF